MNRAFYMRKTTEKGGIALNLAWDMILQSVEIFTLVVGILGIILSILLILSHTRFQKLSGKLDYWIYVDEKLAVLDTNFETDRFIYRHHRTAGAMMITGTIITLIFLFFRLDMNKLTAFINHKEKLQTLNEIILSTAVILGKLAGLIGIALGILLIVSAGKIRTMENKMGSGLTTQPLVDKLNKFHGGLDTILLRHPLILGLAGLAASMLLAYIGSIFLFRTI